MEFMLSLTARFLGFLVISAIFFWPGWLVLKLVTLGRYPRKLLSTEAAIDFPEISALGIAVCGLGAAVTWQLVS